MEEDILSYSPTVVGHLLYLQTYVLLRKNPKPTIDICYDAEFSEFIFSWKKCVLQLTEKNSIYFRRLNTFP